MDGSYAFYSMEAVNGPRVASFCCLAGCSSRGIFSARGGLGYSALELQKRDADSAQKLELT